LPKLFSHVGPILPYLLPSLEENVPRLSPRPRSERESLRRDSLSDSDGWSTGPVLMGAKRSACIKMGQRPHEEKSHTALARIKKKNRKKKGVNTIMGDAEAAVNVVMGNGEDDMFGMGLVAPTRPTTPAKNDPQRPAEVEQPPAFADTDKNDLFRRAFSFNGTKPDSMHPRDARRAHEELLKRQKLLRKQQKEERFLTKEPKPFHTPVLPY
jgi:hypothetical protein